MAEGTPHVKQYPPCYVGPLTVFIRESEMPTSLIKFSLYLHKLYPSVTYVKKVSSDKMKVVFSERVQANHQPLDTYFKNYRVYVTAYINPCIFECVGVIDAMKIIGR